jgi:hypothetical protein
MTIPRTAADVLARHVLFEIESIDRLYLNLYVPELQRVGQVVGFLTRHLGFEIPSTAVIAPRSKAFVEAGSSTASHTPTATASPTSGCGTRCSSPGPTPPVAHRARRDPRTARPDQTPRRRHRLRTRHQRPRPSSPTRRMTSSRT